jgi:hypothetical protein
MKAHARRVNAKEILLLERPLKALKKESLTLSFSKEDEVGISMPYNDALVVTLTVANHGIHWILVNNESLANILYWPIFKQINIDWERIKPFGSLIGVKYCLLDTHLLMFVRLLAALITNILYSFSILCCAGHCNKHG